MTKEIVSIFDVREIEELMQKENSYLEAFQKLQRIETYLNSNSIVSGEINWRMGVCQDYLGNLWDAVPYFLNAVDIDPLNLTYAHSASIVFDKIETEIERIAANSEATEQDSIERMFDISLKNGRVTRNLQFIMIRYYFNIKNYDQARSLIDAALACNPYDRDLLEYRKSIAEIEGDKETLLKIINM